MFRSEWSTNLTLLCRYCLYAIFIVRFDLARSGLKVVQIRGIPIIYHLHGTEQARVNPNRISARSFCPQRQCPLAEFLRIHFQETIPHDDWSLRCIYREIFVYQLAEVEPDMIACPDRGSRVCKLATIWDSRWAQRQILPRQLLWE